MGNLLLAFTLAVVTAIALHTQTERDNQRADALTMEEYVADFESHKEDLRSEASPWWLDLLAAEFLIGGIFLYELVGWELGRFVHVLFRRVASRPYGPPPLTSSG